jgi:hypothetical protein
MSQGLALAPVPAALFSRINVDQHQLDSIATAEPE